MAVKKKKKTAERKSKLMRFRINLMGVKPEIWRRVYVPEHINMQKFAVVLLLAMGWHNSHLHEFEIRGRRFGLIGEAYDIGAGDMPEDEALYRIVDMEFKEGDEFLFEYDFGDGWKHLLVFEGYAENTGSTGFCTEGARNCPPEDCGGVGGYLDMIESFEKPGTPEYMHMFKWLGGKYDPEFFSVDIANRRLKKTDAYIRYGFMNDESALDEILAGYEHQNCGIGLSQKDVYKAEMQPLLMKLDKKQLIRIIFANMRVHEDLVDEMVEYFELDKEKT
ncbi:MAG: plasmid pRiA4b ORF-3 family protein [Candidatus Goldiibacteriota bacterium]